MDVQNYLVSGWTDRALLNFRLSGAAKPLVDSLHDIYVEMLVSGSDYDSTNLVRILSILDTLCQDYDFSTDFATFGGHMLLKKLLNADHTDSDVIDAIENVVCSISTSGCAFPLKNIITNNSAESIVKPTICRFSQGQQSSFQSKDDVNLMVTESHCDSANSNEFAVYLRSIPVSMYGTGQHAVGYLLWSSAVILSRFLVRNEALLLREQSVLECGAGLGLCGIVAGKYAKAVTISDFNEILAQNLVYNIKINQGPELLENNPSVIASSCAMDVCIIDWNTLELKEKSARVTSALSFDSSILEKMKIMESINSRIDRSGETAYDNRNDGTQISNNVVNSGPNSATDHYDCIEKAKERKILKNPGHIVYDVIIGSDLVYCESDTAGISKVVHNYLAENGIFIFVIPKPSHRYGTEHLIPVLLNDGFEIYSWCVAGDKCTSSEVNAADGSKNKKCWISARTNNCLDSNWRDDFLHQNVIFSDILKKLIVDDDYLVCDLDESPFTAWNLIIGHRHR